MSDERPEALLKSALEKIVYFEARSEQLSRDLSSAREESERLKRELAQATQREIEARRELAELQVSAGRAHREMEELARVNEALREERAGLIGKLVEASRIHDVDKPQEAGIDLASFIAELRSEVLSKERPQKPPSTVAGHAERLEQEGRLQVTPKELSELSAGAGFPGRTEETLFGFSCRELSSPDATARLRAADRLRSLGTPAAAPALVTALHSEADPEVQVALLHALAALGAKEGAPLVTRHLASRSPDVRIAALKTLLALDPEKVAPHLTQAIKDPDQTVRRRASLFALGLSGEVALAVGEQAICDGDAQVRTLAARALGAAGGARAREILQASLRDRDVKVRQAAAESLSRILGQDVSPVVQLDDVQRRREVRRIASLPSRPVQMSESPRAKVAVLEVAPPARPEEALCEQLAFEVRSAIRGRSVEELVQLSGKPSNAVQEACELLLARGHLVRRGQKFFAA